MARLKLQIIIFVIILLFVIPFHTNAMTITINVPEKYSDVKAGEKIYFETEVKWPENVGRKDLRIEYFIKDKDGVDKAYLKVLKAIETQASFMDNISIPENLSPGMYTINASISDYSDLNQQVSVSFNVIKNVDKIQRYLFVIIGILGVIILFMIIEMFILVKRKHY